MKKTGILMAVACLLLTTVAAFAQSKTDFSGEWTLDVSKSKLPEMMRIESGTMKVAQTDKDLTVASEIKRAPRPEGAGGGGGMGGQGGGMGRGGMGGGGNQPMTYMLDGKETTSEIGGGQMTGTAKMQAKWDDAKLKLTAARSFNGPNGAVTTTTRETWEIVDGGKGLKLTRETETPRGTQNSEMYFTKK